MKSKIPLICKKLYEKNLIAGSDGNVSEKQGNKIVITPSNVNKSEINLKDLCLINEKGQNLKGQASSEKYMHLAIYKYQKKAQAIAHAHPPSAIALSLARAHWKFLPQALPEIVIALGSVPFAPYTRPGTKQLGESLIPFVQNSKALILSHHGAVVWGENLQEAFSIMEQLEHACKILCLSEAMGQTKTLSQKEVNELLKKTKAGLGL
ncbi:MAG: class II aldolase/adducin family protein [Oligoflexia bacterium]|nr:class II aldolase/adducin family protein [Oligoflexia bacterium]